jgi:hypothetical protein
LMLTFIIDLVTLGVGHSFTQDASVNNNLILVASGIMLLIGVVVEWLPFWIPLLVFVLGIIYFLSSRR